MLWLRDLHPSEFKNAAMLAIALGHTDQEFIYRHYRELVKPEEAEKYWNLFLAELSMTWCQWLRSRGERSSGPVHSYRRRGSEGRDGIDSAVTEGSRMRKAGPASLSKYWHLKESCALLRAGRRERFGVMFVS